MPVTVCKLNGRPGFKWGGRGKCYTYTTGSERSKKAARSKAAAQGVAVRHSQGHNDAISQSAVEQLQRKRGELGLTRTGRRPPQWLYPMSTEVKYRGQLRVLVEEWAKQVRSTIITHLPLLVDEAALERPRADASPAQVARLVGNLRVSMGLSIEGADFETQDIGQKTSDWNDKQWQKIMRSVVGVELFQREPWLAAELESFVAQNVDLITKLKDDTVAEVGRVVQTGLREGKRVETIRKELMSTTLPEGVFRKVRNRAKLIARDQVGKLNGDLQRLRQTNLGIEEYTWRTVGDERVRQTHRAMDGRRCRWDDPTVYYSPSSGKWLKRSGINGVSVHPGRDFQCRCSGEPFMDGLEEEIAPKIKPTPPLPRPAPIRKRRKRAAPKPRAKPVTSTTVAGKESTNFFYGSRRKSVPVKSGTPQFFKPGTQQQALAKEVYANKHEHIGMWKTDGSFIARHTDNKPSQVSLPEQFTSRWRSLRENTEIHNHPGSSAFSPVDIWAGVMRASKDSFVVSKRALYHMHIDDANKNARRYLSVKESYKRNHKAVMRAELKQLNAGPGGKDAIEVLEREHFHKVNTKVADEFDFLTYTKTDVDWGN